MHHIILKKQLIFFIGKTLILHINKFPKKLNHPCFNLSVNFKKNFKEMEDMMWLGIKPLLPKSVTYLLFRHSDAFFFPFCSLL